MATKLGKVSRMGQETAKKVFRPSYIDVNVPAGGASVGPPLGPKLGEFGLPINKFVEDFNDLTKDIKKGIPIPTRVHIEGKKYRIELYEPCVKFLIRQAAGIAVGSYNPTEHIVGKITLRHAYEIGKVKLEQENYKIRNYSMQQMCEMVLRECYELGVEVVEDLDPQEYHEFLEEKKREEEEQKLAEDIAMQEARKKIARKLQN